MIKKTAIAVAAALAVGAPAAFGQGYNPRDPYYSSYDAREYRRVDERDYRRADERDYRRADERREWRRDSVARVIETRRIQAAAGRHECWNPRAGVFEEVREENRTRVGKGAAIGAVAGGVLGHQVDQGGGTAAGAILGGILGHQLEKRQDRKGATQDDLDFSRCRTLASGEAPVYEVRYEHAGREYVTRLDHDPGRRLRLGEDIRRDGTPYDG